MDKPHKFLLNTLYNIAETYPSMSRVQQLQIALMFSRNMGATIDTKASHVTIGNFERATEAWELGLETLEIADLLGFHVWGSRVYTSPKILDTLSYYCSGRRFPKALLALRSTCTTHKQKALTAAFNTIDSINPQKDLMYKIKFALDFFESIVGIRCRHVFRIARGGSQDELKRVAGIHRGPGFSLEFLARELGCGLKSGDILLSYTGVKFCTNKINDYLINTKK